MNGLHGIIFAYEKGSRPSRADRSAHARLCAVRRALPRGRLHALQHGGRRHHRRRRCAARQLSKPARPHRQRQDVGHGAQERRSQAAAALCRRAQVRRGGIPRQDGGSRACGRTCTRSGRSTSSCPTATLSSICRCRRCWTRTSKAARTSPASAPRAASLWKTPRISPSTKRAASPRRAARRTRRAAAAARRSTF